jgi:hypothetical protein
LLSITPTRPRHFLGLDIAAEVTQTSQSQLPGSLLEWDPGKHPRRGGPPNAGWFASKGGGGGAGGTGGQRSIVGGILDRNRAIANLSGGPTPATIRAGKLADELQSAAKLPGEMAAAFASGLKTGGKAVINGGATAVKNVATLGLSTGQLELIGVTDEDRANGYDTAVAIATASGELLIAVGTGGVASALSKGGSVARGASGALLAYDAAGNAVGVVQGSYDAATNGVSIRNGAQIAAGALGLTANVRASRSLRPSNSAPDPTVNPVPKLPPYQQGAKTEGVIRTPSGDVPLRSGRAGPATSLPKGSPGFNAITSTHVEGHAAAHMRQNGLQEATIYINNPRICLPCRQNLAHMLPPDARLTVVLPDGSSETFIGNAR